jgi:hypothetical protein
MTAPTPQASPGPAVHDDRTWHGAYAPYDLVKEFVIALGVVVALVLLLTILFSSPDAPPSTIAQWARSNPSDFVTTAVAELDGSSDTAGYGPPYNNAPGGQKIGPVTTQRWLGVTEPINTANDFVLGPLASTPGGPVLKQALAAYRSAPASQQAAWADAYTKGLAHAKFGAGSVTMPPGNYGPVAPMMSALLGLSQSGGLDGALLTSQQFYQTDYAKPLLFLADGSNLSDRAQQEHLLGTQWGMMNETGSYPGQVWLWLYTFWYQIKPFSTSDNADALVWGLMAVLSLAFICIPFIPGVRSLPRHLRVYRLIWRDHYREVERTR